MSPSRKRSIVAFGRGKRGGKDKAKTMRVKRRRNRIGKRGTPGYARKRGKPGPWAWAKVGGKKGDRGTACPLLLGGRKKTVYSTTSRKNYSSKRVDSTPNIKQRERRATTVTKKGRKDRSMVFLK